MTVDKTRTIPTYMLPVFVLRTTRISPNVGIQRCDITLIYVLKSGLKVLVRHASEFSIVHSFLRKAALKLMINITFSVMYDSINALQRSGGSWEEDEMSRTLMGHTSLNPQVVGN